MMSTILVVLIIAIGAVRLMGTRPFKRTRAFSSAGYWARGTRIRSGGVGFVVIMITVAIIGIFTFAPHDTTSFLAARWQALTLFLLAALSLGIGRQMEGRDGMGYVPGYVGFALGVLLLAGSLFKFF